MTRPDKRGLSPREEQCRHEEKEVRRIEERRRAIVHEAIPPEVLQYHELLNSWRDTDPRYK